MQPASAVMMYLDAPMADLELVKLINCLLLHAAPVTVLHCVSTQESACPMLCPEILQMKCPLQIQDWQSPPRGHQAMTQRLDRLSYGAGSTCCLLCSLISDLSIPAPLSEVACKQDGRP